MKQIKKLIAREFLVFLSGIVLFSVIWFTWTQMHSYQETKASNLANELKEFKEFEPYNSLLQYVELANSGKYNNWDDIDTLFPQFDEFDKQALKDYVATVNAEKYDDFTVLNSKFPEFGFDSTGVHKNFSLKKLEDLQDKSKSLEQTRASFFYDPISQDDLFSLGIIMITILFGVRYLVYSIKWSLNQLKEN